MTLYDDLGVPPDATEAEIKAAHRAHARRHHPDNGGSMDAFTRGQRAYEVLIDPRRRQDYDETGSEGVSDPEAAERAEVLDTIGKAVMDHIDGNVDLTRTDVLAHATQIVERALAEGRRNKAKFEAALERIDQAAKRFKLNTEGTADVVQQVLDGRRRQVLFQIDHCERAIRVQTKALEVLEGYSYRLEEPLPVAGLDFTELAQMVNNQRGAKAGA